MCIMQVPWGASVRSPGSSAGDDSMWPDVLLGIRQSSAYSYPVSHLSSPVYFLYNSKQIYKVFVPKNWKKIYHLIKSIYFKIFLCLSSIKYICWSTYPFRSYPLNL